MKILKLTILLTAVFVAMQINAQTSLQSIDSTIEYDDAQRPCIQINIDPEPKALKHAWKDYLNDNYDFKLKGIGFLSNKDLLSAEAILVPQISSNQMDFYTHVVEDENGSEMKIFVRYGYDIFLTPENNPNDYDALTEILDDFLKYYLPKYYEGKVKDTEKRIKKLSGETSDLEAEIADDSARIAKLKEEIEELQSDLKTNNELLEIAKTKLKKRSEKLARIRNQLREL